MVCHTASKKRKPLWKLFFQVAKYSTGVIIHQQSRDLCLVWMWQLFSCKYFTVEFMKQSARCTVYVLLRNRQWKLYNPKKIEFISRFSCFQYTMWIFAMKLCLHSGLEKDAYNWCPCKIALWIGRFFNV